jgi:predicted transcriptional regulator/adenylate kinase
MQHPKVALISLHPEHAAKILSGEKKLEFRRTWASSPVEELVIYVTAPVQRIVAIAKVKQIHRGSRSALWNLTKSVGGGLSRQALFDYFAGKVSGFAIELSEVLRFPRLLEPTQFIEGFHPPQSFCYIGAETAEKLRSELSEMKSTGRLLFIAGVHGVGKTTLCDRYAVQRGLPHKSASQLIREANQAAICSKSKAVRNIADNQKLLVNAVQQYREAGENLLLDGHFALWDKEHRPQPLDIEVFSQLGIDGIVVVHDTPAKIAQRLKKRDTHGASTAAVGELQRIELLRAVEVAKALGIPMATVRSGDASRFAELLDVLG